MNFKIILILALISFTFAKKHFTKDVKGKLKKLLKKHPEFVSCLKTQIKETPDEEIKDFLMAVKEKDKDTVYKLGEVLFKSKKKVMKQCLKNKLGAKSKTRTRRSKSPRKLSEEPLEPHKRKPGGPRNPNKPRKPRKPRNTRRPHYEPHDEPHDEKKKRLEFLEEDY